MKDIELIIFDLDGTLVDSRGNIVDAINDTLRNLGLKERNKQEISTYIGTGIEDLIKKSLGEKEKHFFAKALPMFEERYKKRAANSSILYPNVKDVLEQFKNKKKVIVTNGKYEIASLVITSLGVQSYFAEIVGGDTAGCRKPSPCPLDNIILEFNVAKQKAIIVGDMDIDILAGKRAGILTCAVTYGIGGKEAIVKAEPDFIIDDIIKLKEIIK